MSSLERFVKAQERDFFTALKEVRHGKKQSHWMWYIFPQIRGLGTSPTAQKYAIRDLEEAKDYLRDPYLEGNLSEICNALMEQDCSDPHEIFGSPDDLKLQSSMTLFEAADGGEDIFSKILDRFYGGKRDQKTLDIIGE
jgi:uncharacterized protein (DUF1810 family)